MSQTPESLPTNEEIWEASLCLQGYTISARGMCVARIGAEYVMRDRTQRCVRVPVETTDLARLSAAWAEFGHPEREMTHASDVRDAAWNGTVSPNDVAMVLEGYTNSTRGMCLARSVGNYVTRDGMRHCIRFLVDTVDPVALNAAWAAFSKAAGWMGPTAVERAGIPGRSTDQWGDSGRKRLASG